MAGIPELEVTAEVQPLADSIVQLLQLPPKAVMDVTHVAFAIVHRMDYLLTWNCTHLANGTLQKTLFEYCTSHHLHMAGDLHARTPHQAATMKDPIIQEVRDARAAVAADFGYDLHQFFAWTKTHTAAEQNAKHWLPTGPPKALEKKSGVSKPPVTRKPLART